MKKTWTSLKTSINIYFDRPSNLSDIKPFENLWSILTAIMRKLDYTLKDHMISSLMQVWLKDKNGIELCEKTGLIYDKSCERTY